MLKTWVLWLVLNVAAVSLLAASGSVQIADLPERLQPTIGKLEVGAKRLTDRRYEITVVPEELRGLTYVTIARGDLKRPAGEYVFTVDQPVTVYLAMQDRGNPTPPEGWERTFLRLGFRVEVGGGDIRRYDDIVWKRDFPAGKVEIPGHDGTDGISFGLPNMAILAPRTASATTTNPITAPTTASNSNPAHGKVIR